MGTCTFPVCGGHTSVSPRIMWRFFRRICDISGQQFKQKLKEKLKQKFPTFIVDFRKQEKKFGESATKTR